MKTQQKMGEAVRGPEAKARDEREASVEHSQGELSALARAAAGGSEVTPAQVHKLHRLIGNRAVSSLMRAGRLPVVQPRLRIGPVHDAYEREADRMASEVLRADVPAQATHVQRRAASITPLVQRHAGHGAHTHEHEDEDDGHALIQRKPEAAANQGFEAAADLSARVAQMSTRGAALDAPLRGEMEARFGADFSGVRIHTDAEAARLSRDMGAEAFTHGRHIAFAEGKYTPHTSAGKWLLAHELTHTIQQAGMGGPSRADSSVVQRHSTHEHYLIGTLKPDQLASLPSIREQVAKAKVDKDPTVIDETARAQVVHLLREEMRRLLEWQNKGPLRQMVEQERKFGGRIGEGRSKEQKVEKGKDHDYEVSYVRIPTLNDTSVICTYGELNTLADMFGTIEDMSDTRPDVILGMLQGVRQRVYIELYNIYTEIEGAKVEAKRKKKGPTKLRQLDPMGSFKGAIGFTGKEKPVVGGAMAVMAYEKATLDRGKFTPANATAALARNACHFAPETWYTWARYHNKARELAKYSYDRGEDVKDVQRVLDKPDEIKDLSVLTRLLDKQKAEQREAANKALLYGAFGDHYLQDAYASGHLIDKTRIMQWFFAWQKKKGLLEGLVKDKVLDAHDIPMMGVIAQQDLKSNPQMMQNVKGGVSEKLEHIGVTPEEHIVLLMWWRALAAHSPRDFKAMTVTRVLKDDTAPLAKKTEKGVREALDALLELGFATLQKAPKSAKKGRAEDKYVLGEAHYNVLFDSPKKKSPYKAVTKKALFRDNDLEGYKEQAKEFYYVAYIKFMDHARTQLITNYLHDKFCKEGLWVGTRGCDYIGKIYGDTTMLSAGAQDGILHSATTAEMAREAIYDILEEGKAKHSTEEIDARFPRQVLPIWDGSVGRPLPIEDWWVELERECTKDGNSLFQQGVDWSVKGAAVKYFKQQLTQDEQLLTSVKDIKDQKEVDKVVTSALDKIARPAHDPVF